MARSKQSSTKSKSRSSKTKPIEKTLFECLQEAREGSEIQVHQDNLTTEKPGCIIIRLRGPVAAVPCFKNNRNQGRWLKNNVLARLNVMDQLYEQATQGRKIRYEDTPLFVYARFSVTGSKRGTGFDADNAFTTVKDWCEPRFKRNRDRGWGIGISTDDRYIKGFAEQREKEDEESNITEIVIRPLETMTDALTDFRERCLSMKKWEFNHARP